MSDGAASMSRLAGLDAARVEAFFEAEAAVHAAARPQSRALSGKLAEGFYDGVPMHWMRDWPMPFAMFGHSPEPVARAIAAARRRQRISLRSSGRCISACSTAAC